jgi:hypothetical protein
MLSVGDPIVFATGAAVVLSGISAIGTDRLWNDFLGCQSFIGEVGIPRYRLAATDLVAFVYVRCVRKPEQDNVLVTLTQSYDGLISVSMLSATQAARFSPSPTFD